MRRKALRQVWVVVLYCLIHTAEATKHREYVTEKYHLELLSWAVQFYLPGRELTLLPKNILDAKAQNVASQSGLINGGQIGSLKSQYLLYHPYHGNHEKNQTVLSHEENVRKLSKNILPTHWNLHGLDGQHWNSVKASVHAVFDNHPDVASYSQQVVKQRYKRSIKFADPAYPRQWHLHNTAVRSMDINVIKVWERNITGRNITAAVVDDGLDWNNADLLANYDPDASWDLNGKKPDPSPTDKSKKNHHGTRCAGEIAAVANTVCAVGVAYNTKIAGLKVLDGPMTDSLEAEAFTKNIHKIDVYSCSWGPDDDGKTVDGPHHLAVKALMHSVEYGRVGYGSIFVVASGNGGSNYDNCNFDGYANSIYTITIGAVDEFGAMPYYAEECASMLAVTFSSGGGRTRDIVTTDWTFDGASGCTENHSGTSAAAPLAAGMIALMLDVQPCLTWRDVQHIIVMAAKKIDIDVAHWTRNAAGFHHSHKHGFGLMDAWRLVNAAKLWKPVPWMTLFTSEEMIENAPIPAKSQPLVKEYYVTRQKLDGFSLATLEYVHVTVTLVHSHRGDVELHLVCPSGTKSVLAATRKLDTSAAGFKDWIFSTVRCWGEKPDGTWKVIITDKGGSSVSRGALVKWQLQLYGSPMSSAEVQERKRLVEEASKGDHLFDNHTTECVPPPLRNHLVKPMSERVLKIIALTSVFCLVMSLYESMEYMCCYGDEKKEHKRQLEEEAKRRREEGRTERRNGGCTGGRQREDEEETRLLDAEEIPLQTLPPSTRAQSTRVSSEYSEMCDNRGYCSIDDYPEVTVNRRDFGDTSPAKGNSAISDDTVSSQYETKDVVSSSENILNLHIPKTFKSSQVQSNTCGNKWKGAGTGGTLNPGTKSGACGGAYGAAGGTSTIASEGNPYQPLLGHTDVTLDPITSQLLRHNKVPDDLVTPLTPEEIRLNMALVDSDEELLFETNAT